MPYGHMRVLGASTGFEYFRATFGGPITCGARRVVLAPPEATPTPIPAPTKAPPSQVPSSTPVPSLPAKDADADDADDADDGGVVLTIDGEAMGSPDADADEAEAEAAPAPTPVPGANRVLCAPFESPAVRGAFLVAWRGVCPFSTKALHAHNAGAAGLILVNSAEGLLRPPKGAVPAADTVSMPIVMVRNLTGPVLLEAVASAEEQLLPLYAALDPARDPCVMSELDDAANAAALLVAPDGQFPTAGTPGENGISDEGLSKNMALSEAGFISFEPAERRGAGGRLPPDVPTSATEFVLAHFSGVLLPGLRAVLSFPEPFDGCSPFVGDEAAAVQGTFAVLERGTCPMIHKARHAQDAGAAGVLFVNTGATPPPPDAPEAAQLPGFYGPHVGSVSSHGDGMEPVVRIPAAMVTREAAGGWRSARDAFAGAVATFRLSAARAGSWPALVAARNAGDAYWADTSEDRTAQLRELLLAHHAASHTGSAEREAFLRALAGVRGLTAELAAAEASVDWHTASSEPWARAQEQETDLLGHAEATPSDLLFPGLVSPYLSQRLPASLLDPSAAAMACVVNGKVSVRMDRFDLTSSFGLDKKLGALLRTHACLERALMHHASVVGDSIRLFQDRRGMKAWDKLASTLAQPFNTPQDAALPLLQQFVRFAEEHREALDGDQDTPIGAALRA